MDSSLTTFRFENGSTALIFLYFLTLPIAAVEYPDRSLIMESTDGLPYAQSNYWWSQQGPGEEKEENN